MSIVAINPYTSKKEDIADFLYLVNPHRVDILSSSTLADLQELAEIAIQKYPERFCDGADIGVRHTRSTGNKLQFPNSPHKEALSSSPSTRADSKDTSDVGPSVMRSSCSTSHHRPRSHKKKIVANPVTRASAPLQRGSLSSVNHQTHTRAVLPVPSTRQTKTSPRETTAVLKGPSDYPNNQDFDSSTSEVEEFPSATGIAAALARLRRQESRLRADLLALTGQQADLPNPTSKARPASPRDDSTSQLTGIDKHVARFHRQRRQNAEFDISLSHRRTPSPRPGHPVEGLEPHAPCTVTPPAHQIAQRQAHPITSCPPENVRLAIAAKHRHWVAPKAWTTSCASSSTALEGPGSQVVTPSALAKASSPGAETKDLLIDPALLEPTEYCQNSSSGILLTPEEPLSSRDHCIVTSFSSTSAASVVALASKNESCNPPPATSIPETTPRIIDLDINALNQVIGESSTSTWLRLADPPPFVPQQKPEVQPKLEARSWVLLTDSAPTNSSSLNFLGDSAYDTTSTPPRQLNNFIPTVETRGEEGFSNGLKVQGPADTCVDPYVDIREVLNTVLNRKRQSLVKCLLNGTDIEIPGNVSSDTSPMERFSAGLARAETPLLNTSTNFASAGATTSESSPVLGTGEAILYRSLTSNHLDLARSNLSFAFPPDAGLEGETSEHSRVSQPYSGTREAILYQSLTSNHLGLARSNLPFALPPNAGLEGEASEHSKVSQPYSGTREAILYRSLTSNQLDLVRSNLSFALPPDASLEGEASEHSSVTQPYNTVIDL